MIPPRVCAFGMSPERQPVRSLEQYLADLQAEYDRLPMQHSRRGQLVTLIRAAEEEIDARAPL